MTKKEQDYQLSFENELRELQISAETGAQFHSGNEPSSLQVKSEFLNYIEAFNKATEKKEFKSVREVLGNPSFPRPIELTNDELSSKLSSLYDLLEKNCVAVDTIYEVPSREIYRFIVEDLFDYEMSIIEMPGLVTHFTYEEFHPNDKEDLKRYTTEFIEMVDKKSFEFMHHVLHDKCTHQERELSCDEFIDVVANARENFGELVLEQIAFKAVNINDDHASVICLPVFKNGARETNQNHAKFEFINDYGYWFLRSVTIPALNL